MPACFRPYLQQQEGRSQDVRLEEGRCFFVGGGGGGGRQPNTEADKATYSFYRSPEERRLVSVLTSSSGKGGPRM